jgi:hypothetical protein
MVAAQASISVAAPSSPAATRTGSVSCHGFDFLPLASDTEYYYRGTARVSSSNGAFFACDPGLPTGAVVTKVSFTVEDNNVGAQVTFCGLDRSGLTAATARIVKTLAAVPGTGIAAAPGLRRLTTTNISFATIDNTQYAYWLQCSLDHNPVGGPPDVVGIGLYGADIVYRMGT